MNRRTREGGRGRASTCDCRQSKDLANRVPANRQVAVASTRRGFTLVELLVVITIIGMLVAMLLPAVQHARELAREATCKNRQKQVSLAVLEYEAAHGKLPKNEDLSGLPASWLVHILPYLDQKAMYDKWDELDQTQRPFMEVLTCPSNPCEQRNKPVSGYIGNGMIFVEDDEAAMRLDFIDQRDGTSNTLMIAETRNLRRWDLYQDGAYKPWSMTFESTRMVDHDEDTGTDDVNDLDSTHSGGFVAAFCDGHIKFISDSIDIIDISDRTDYTVYELLVDPNDGVPFDDNWLE